MGRTTLLVDLFGLVAAALPDWVVQPARVVTQLGTPPTVLIVEDSHFFAHHITWSAACSTGQEVYSIAMMLKELPIDFGHYSPTILGTDISGTALAQASYGCYNKVEMARGLSPDRITRYFQAMGSQWRVKDELRALVSFRKLNLLESFAALGTFDIIFCRNVAIYFSQADRTQLFERLAKHLHPAGALLIGATESLQGITTRYIRKVYHNTIFYQLR